MPKRSRNGKNSRSRKRRRYSRKVRSKRRNYIHTPRQGLIVADRQLVKLRFRNTLTLNATNVSAAYHTYQANGMYDCDISGIGHQPLGFDQWMDFYNHYTVLGAEMVATFIPTDSSVQLTPQWCGILVSSGSAPGTIQAESILEQKHLRKSMLTLPTAKGMTTVRQKVSIKKFLGQRYLMDEDNNAGTKTTNPSEGVYFHVITAPHSTFYDPSSVSVTVQITFVALLHEVRQLSQS